MTSDVTVSTNALRFGFGSVLPQKPRFDSVSIRFFHAELIGSLLNIGTQDRRGLNKRSPSLTTDVGPLRFRVSTTAPVMCSSAFLGSLHVLP